MPPRTWASPIVATVRTSRGAVKNRRITSRSTTAPTTRAGDHADRDADAHGQPLSEEQPDGEPAADAAHRAVREVHDARRPVDEDETDGQQSRPGAEHRAEDDDAERDAIGDHTSRREQRQDRRPQRMSARVILVTLTSTRASPERRPASLARPLVRRRSACPFDAVRALLAVLDRDRVRVPPDLAAVLHRRVVARAEPPSPDDAAPTRDRRTCPSRTSPASGSVRPCGRRSRAGRSGSRGDRRQTAGSSFRTDL